MTIQRARTEAAPGLGRTARAIAAVTLGFTAIGCGPGPTTAPSSAASIAPPSPTAPGSIAPTAPPATEAGAVEPCSPSPTAPGPGCEMPAGDYHAAQVGGGISFTLTGGPWTNVAYLPEILSLQADTNWLAFMAAPINIPRRDIVKAAADAAAAQDLMGKLPGITVTALDEPVAVDGRDGVAFDVANTGDAPQTLLWLGNTSGRYGLDPGASVRIIWLDGDVEPFLIAIEARTNAFEAFLAESAPMLESVVFD